MCKFSEKEIGERIALLHPSVNAPKPVEFPDLLKPFITKFFQKERENYFPFILLKLYAWGETYTFAIKYNSSRISENIIIFLIDEKYKYK